MDSSTNSTNSLSQIFLNHLDITIGPWIIGSWLDFLFNGVIAIQVYNYYTSKQKDRPIIRWLVAVLVFMAVFKTVTIGAGVWKLCMKSIQDITLAPYLFLGDWLLVGHPATTFVADAVTQVFFTGRYYVLTGRRWFIAFTVIGITIEAISVSMMTKSLTLGDFPGVKTWGLCHWVTTLVTDVVITSCTCVHFYQRRSLSHNTSLNILAGNLFTVTLQSALLPTIFSTLIAIMFLATPFYNLGEIVFILGISKVNIISVLYTLNQREVIRKAYAEYHEEEDRSIAVLTKGVGETLGCPNRQETGNSSEKRKSFM